MKKRYHCNLCGSSRLSCIVSAVADYESNLKEVVDILKCDECELVQQSNIYESKEIEKFYDQEYHGRNYSSDGFASRIARILRKRYYYRFIRELNIIGVRKTARILDYGSGDGFLLKLLHEQGYSNLYACDFFPPAMASSKEAIFFRPDNIGSFQDFFDFVFMINSIEHLASFKHDFSAILAAMKTGSSLLIETPNIGSLDFHIFRKYWGGLHQPRHTFLWNKDSLAGILNRLGLDSKHIGSPQSAHWAISIQNILLDKLTCLKSSVRNGRMPFYVLLVILTLPVGILQNLARRESVINLVGFKR